MMLRHSAFGFATTLLFCLALPSVAATSEPPEPKNQVSFSVERDRSVENDWVSANVSVTHENKDPAQLADQINRDIDWALGIAKGATGIEVRTAGYQTYPVDSKLSSSVRHWRGSQSLVIEGADPAKVSALLGKLQEKLQLTGLSFSVSPTRRRSVEDELIAAALDGFRSRADLIRKKLGARGYEIVRIDVNSSGGGPVPMRMRAMSASEVAISAPSLEGGTSDIQISVNGTVELAF